MLKPPSDDSDDASKQPDKSFFDDLAKRSSGLPEHQKPVVPDTQEKSPWAYAGLGLQFAGSVGLFAFAGYKIDQWQHWNNAALITLTLIAVVGNMYLLIKESIRADSRADTKADKPHQDERQKK